MRGCGGFPLALKVVGRSLYGEPEVIWKNRLKWSEAQSILYSNNELLICLQPSLDALMECIKSRSVSLDAMCKHIMRSKASGTRPEDTMDAEQRNKQDDMRVD